MGQIQAQDHVRTPEYSVWLIGKAVCRTVLQLIRSKHPYSYQLHTPPRAGGPNKPRGYTRAEILVWVYSVAKETLTRKTPPQPIIHYPRRESRTMHCFLTVF